MQKFWWQTKCIMDNVKVANVHERLQNKDRDKCKTNNLDIQGICHHFFFVILHMRPKKADLWSVDYLVDPCWQTTPTNHPYYLWPLGLKRFAQTF